MKTVRIYLTTDDQTGEKALVKAANQAQALRHIAGNRFTVKAATSMEVADAMSDGVMLQVANDVLPDQESLDL
jgi:hypothetical protein